MIEADEYDRSFLHGHPHVAIITNVEHDHPDIYPTFESVVEAFTDFAGRVRPDGRLIVNAASPAVPVAAAAQRVRPVVDTPRGRASPAAPRDDPNGGRVDIAAAAARPAASTCSTAPSAWAASACGSRAATTSATRWPWSPPPRRLAWTARPCGPRWPSYRGAERRFQLLGRAAGVTVIDDYAHHPTEIAATLAAARGRRAGA